MAAPNSVPDLLAKTVLFGRLDEGERAAVAQQMRRSSFRAGQTIFQRGDAGADIYLVTQGRVRLSIVTSEGRELSFAHAGPGSIFGEIAALDGGPRTADAVAVSAVEAMVVSSAVLKRLMEKSPALATAAIAFLCHRLREADQQLEAVALYPIEVRLARLVLQLAAQHGGAEAKTRLVELGMSQSELALLLGASRPKVNAALMMLEDQGAIARKGKALECEMGLLREIGQVE